jgi:hypothetical protein
LDSAYIIASFDLFYIENLTVALIWSRMGTGPALAISACCSGLEAVDKRFQIKIQICHIEALLSDKPLELLVYVSCFLRIGQDL